MPKQPDILQTRSAMFRHCSDFYGLLDDLAKTEPVTGTEFRVFRGYLTNVFKELNLSTSYYTKLRRLLEANGCMQIIQAGARGIESCVVLLAPPEEVDWQDGGFASPLTGNAQAATLRQELENVKRTLGGIDLGKVLINIETRLGAVEEKLGLTPGE